MKDDKKKCFTCGKVFIAKHGNEKYCSSDCRAENHRAKNRVRMQNLRDTSPEYNEKMRLYARKYYAAHSSEKIACQKKYYLANREYYKVKSHEYYLRDLKKILTGQNNG